MDNNYSGFEQGPIRPPSESESLLIRISRNCPWNRCTFCPVYKGSDFSLRELKHIIFDIDAIKESVDTILSLKDDNGTISQTQLFDAKKKIKSNDYLAFHTALNWISGGMKSIFIQDANSLIIKPNDLVIILKHIQKCFPQVQRVTSYARSHTINRIKDDLLKEISESGLNRIHIGLESGSDKVLEYVKKGITKEGHIKAGLKVKNAGMELSEYVMPGLGGRKFSEEHALETADTLNQINPDFIRLRSLAIPNHVELYKDFESGKFEKCTDFEVANEILILLENLDGITSTIKSDHILNLFEDIEGKLPEDKDKMIDIVKIFLGFSKDSQMIYQVGRRTGVFRSVSDMNNPEKVEHVRKTCEHYDITPNSVDQAIDELIKRFI
ncbi:MAG: radical SAM protein [Desulfobacterales bacterium]|nr:radical SAM protein [Desulfobacterales bacterium]MCP4159453.1 radical SAM protein [Deltaproteobacteria bacterium]